MVDKKQKGNEDKTSIEITSLYKQDKIKFGHRKAVISRPESNCGVVRKLDQTPFAKINNKKMLIHLLRAM